MLPRAEVRVSEREKQRRHAAVRQKMQQAGLDTLLVSGVKFVGTLGYLRYLTNWAEPFSGEYLLFPLEGEPLFFARTTERAHLAREVLGMNVRLGSTVQAVSSELQERRIRRIGLCSLRTVLADFYVGLTRAMPDCEWVEAASLLDEVRMVKSEEELGWVRQSASLGDLAFQIFLTLVQEGVTEHLVFTELDHMVKLAGAETTYFMTGCGPNPVLKFMDMATERYQQGDVVLFNAEIAGPGGYFTQLVRTVSLGPPRPEVQQAFRAATGALEAAEALLKPGVQASTVYQAVRTTLEEAGYSLNLHPGHSQGLDIFERPLLDGKDNAELLPGMIVVVHPLANMASGGGVWVGETFVITETGAQRLHRSSRCLAQCGIPPGA